jgi:Ca2+-binding EF-hand superfamily protein
VLTLDELKMMEEKVAG